MNTQSYAAIALNDGEGNGWLIVDEDQAEVERVAEEYVRDHPGEAIIIIVPVLRKIGEIA